MFNLQGGVKVQDNKETPDRKRERLRQKELKRNPTVSLNDAFNRANSGSLVDLVGSIGWKGTGLLILVLIMGVIIASIFFK